MMRGISDKDKWIKAHQFYVLILVLARVSSESYFSFSKWTISKEKHVAYYWTSSKILMKKPNLTLLIVELLVATIKQKYSPDA